MTRKEFDVYINEAYGIEADHPWDSPEAVYRHKSNRKWFAIVLSVKKSKLFTEEKEATSKESPFEESIFKNSIKNKGTKKAENEENIDIVNLKCPPEIMETIWLDPDIFPAYHMNKKHWISIPLDGSVSKDKIAVLVEKSFEATAFKPKKQKNKK